MVGLVSEPGGRPQIGADLRALIRRMSVENLLWRAPRIQVTWSRDWHGPAHLRRASDESARGGAMSKGEAAPSSKAAPSKVICDALDPPVGGTFHFENLIHAPSDKYLSKNDSAHKGGSLCVKDVFAKKFLVPGEDSAGGASASA